MCSSEELDFEEGLDVPQAEYQVRLQERAAKELKRRHQLLSQVRHRVLTDTDTVQYIIMQIEQWT